MAACYRRLGGGFHRLIRLVYGLRLLRQRPVQVATLAYLFVIYGRTLVRWKRGEVTARGLAPAVVLLTLAAWALIPANSSDVLEYLGFGRLFGLYGLNPYTHTYSEISDSFSQYVTWDNPMRRLRGLDAAFLSFETPSSHMHVAQASVFDPTHVAGGYSFERLRQLVESRLGVLPPFRRRLVEVPLGLGTPAWIEDPAFDLENHLSRAALPAPGGADELAAFTADFVSRPLDRRQPLWEMQVVEGLEGGS